MKRKYNMYKYFMNFIVFTEVMYLTNSSLKMCLVKNVTYSCDNIHCCISDTHFLSSIKPVKHVK